jgi:hypothetical protein
MSLSHAFKKGVDMKANIYSSGYAGMQLTDLKAFTTHRIYESREAR